MRFRQLVARCLLGGAALVGIGFAVGPAPASAHAIVVSSDPVDGVDLTVAPARVSVTFSEAVGLGSGYLRVIDSSGRRVDAGAGFHPDGRDAVIAVDLQSGLPSSAYLVSFRVVSADSHPVSGVVRFSVGGASLDTIAAAESGPSADGTTADLLSASRALTFVGLAVAGGWWVVLLAGRYLAESEPDTNTDTDTDTDTEPEPEPEPDTEPDTGTRSRRLTRLITVALIAALVGSLGELVLQGPYIAGVGPGGITSLGRLADTMAGSYGRWHLVQIGTIAALLVVVAGGLLAVPLRSARATAGGFAVVWLLVLVSVAATGHASVDRPVWLGEISVLVHLIAITAWIGGLAVLAVAVLRGHATVAQPVLTVFSPVALGCVVAIAASGTYQSWREVGSWSAFVDTEYGVLVLIKIGLFAALIGLGVVARRVLHRTGGGPAHRRLRPGVLVELGLAVAVLCVSAVLVGEPPGRVATAASAPADSATVTLDAGRTLSVQVVPARAGTVVIAASVAGGPSVQTMTATATLPARTIGPIPVALSALGQQRFGSLPVDLPVAGVWQFTVNVQTSEFDIVTATVNITLAS